MGYINQLTRYYASKGVTGADMEKAIREDADRVKANVVASGHDPETFIEDQDNLTCLFIFDNTHEGPDYWIERSGWED